MADDMITYVLNRKGQRLSKKDTFDKLVALNPNDKYKKQKAAGSMGGSVTNNFIKSSGSDYECMRDLKDVATAWIK